jgi:hypothetical protein
VELVAFARMRHLGNQVAVRPVGQVILNRFVGAPPRHHFNLIRRRDHDFLRHVPDDLVHHEHHRHAKLFGQVESFDGQIETFLR